MPGSPTFSWRSALSDFKLGWYASPGFHFEDGGGLVIEVFSPGVDHPDYAVALKTIRERLILVAALAEPENVNAKDHR